MAGQPIPSIGSTRTLTGSGSFRTLRRAFMRVRAAVRAGPSARPTRSRSWILGVTPPAAAEPAAGGVTPKIQLLLRVGLADGPALTAALTRMKALRSVRKEPEPVSVRVDPMDGIG